MSGVIFTVELVMQKKGEHMFHIHYDFYELPRDGFEEEARELAFLNSDFSEFPDGHRGPKKHLTFKTSNQTRFSECWEKAVLLGKTANAPGYLEGELVFSDERIDASQPYNESTIPSFSIQRRSLEDDEGFRQDEVHITYRRKGSDERVWRKFSEMGMAIAVMPKVRRDNPFEAIILTTQGKIAQVRPLKKRLVEHLSNLGGVIDATIKEEIVIDYYLFNITAKDLPSVIGRVVF